MLAPADAALAARDAAVPGLRTVLDPPALLGRLAEALPDATLGEGRAEYVRYKPATSCTVGYRFVVEGRDVDAYAKAVAGEGAPKLDKALEQAPPAGPAALRAVEVGDGVVVAFFPNDPRLPGVGRLGDPKRRRRLLAAVLPEHEALWEAPLQRLRYKPERRYVARVGPVDGTAAVIKCYADTAFASARRGMRGAAEASPHVAPLLGASRQRAVLAFPWLPGRPLDELLASADADAGGPDLLAVLDDVGRALLAVHRGSTRNLAVRGPVAEAQRLDATVRSLAAILPAAEQRAALLAADLTAAVLTTEDPTAAVHGDFSADQVLVGPDTLHLIDFDQTAAADPAADFGRFAAALDADVLDGRLSAAHAAAAIGALCDGYRAAGGTLDDDRLRLHRVMALVHVAPEPFRHRRASWPAHCEERLRHAAAVWTS